MCAHDVDRGEWFSGVEVSWKIQPALFLVAACGGGGSHKADLLNEPRNYTNPLTRCLLGAERKLSRRSRPGLERHQSTPYVQTGQLLQPRLFTPMIG